jgi:hypothetical protein
MIDYDDDSSFYLWAVTRDNRVTINNTVQPSISDRHINILHSAKITTSENFHRHKEQYEF